MHQQNIHDMYSTVENDTGFDAIIVVSSNRAQSRFWQKQLTGATGSVIGKTTRIISLEEDWPGGAGQFLGTLYAWHKAQRYEDVQSILEGGGSVAMYHTAGKGTRMAPLPASEANNKSAIKLPRVIETDTGKRILTVLEAVIFQTGIFARSRRNRLCVFWGDQVFIPSKSVDFEDKYHAEILDIRSEIPSDADTWAREWQSYGLIIPGDDGALQREKQTWQKLQQLVAAGTIKRNSEGKYVLGKSLGCFSISYQLLSALIEESRDELKRKQRKLDTDPHLWMPLTSDQDEFLSSGGNIRNWKRVHKFKDRFVSQDDQTFSLFGDKDLGDQTLWWDYGQVRLYYENCLKALGNSFESSCVQKFYDMEAYHIQRKNTGGLDIQNAIIINSDVKGRIRNCILINSREDSVELSNCVVLNSVISDVQATGSLMYNCTHLVNEKLDSGSVVADISLPPQGRVRMRTNLSRDGKDDWETTIPGNPYTYAELAKLVEKSR